MATSKEHLEILKMVQNGRMTAEEGARLLEAMEPSPRAERPSQSERPANKPYQIRIRVTDLQTGREYVDIRMPWNLIDVGANMGARLAREEIKLEELAAAVQAGAEGRVMDIVDEERQERTEVFVETGPAS
jgi:hypothetical protein